MNTSSSLERKLTQILSVRSLTAITEPQGGGESIGEKGHKIRGSKHEGALKARRGFPLTWRVASLREREAGCGGAHR